VASDAGVQGGGVKLRRVHVDVVPARGEVVGGFQENALDAAASVATEKREGDLHGVLEWLSTGMAAVRLALRRPAAHTLMAIPAAAHVIIRSPRPQ